MSDLDCYAIQTFFRNTATLRLSPGALRWETLSISDLVLYGWARDIMILQIHGDLVSVWYYTDHKADLLFGSPEGAKAFVTAVNELMGEDLISTGDT